MTQSSPPPPNEYGQVFREYRPKRLLLEDTEHPPPNEYGQMVREYRPKRENGRENGEGIYGSLYKLSLSE